MEVQRASPVAMGGPPPLAHLPPPPGPEFWTCWYHGNNSEGCLQNFVLLVISSHAVYLIYRPVGIVNYVGFIRNIAAPRIGLYFHDKTRFA